jgi:hypothetical protein
MLLLDGDIERALSDRPFRNGKAVMQAERGLHRMDPGNAKLVEIDELKSSFLGQRKKIEQLQGLRIESLDAGDLGHVADLIWDVLRDLRVGVGKRSWWLTARGCTISCLTSCHRSIGTTR